MRNAVKLLLALSVIFACLPVAGQTEFFVSPDADDAGDGSFEKPFNDVQKAVLQARTAEGDVNIFLREGKYLLSESLKFTPLDGRSDRHLTIRAFPGEKAVISSGVTLNLDWKPYKKGIMMAHVDRDYKMDMIVAGGTLRRMARFPNYDAKAVRFNGTSADATSPKRVKSWKNPAGGYLHAMHRSDWGDFHYIITGKTQNGEIEMNGGWQNNRKSGLHPEYRMVENIFEELDDTGEWYYSSQDHILYYFPYPDEDLSSEVFESPQLKHLIEFKGSSANPVRNITLEGLELTETVRTFMEEYEPLLRSDWTIYRGGAVILEGTENCSIKDCDMMNLGGNAIFFSNFNRNSGVSGCHIMNIGASAICFVGDPDAVRSPSFEYGKFVPYDQLDHAKGPITDNYPEECYARDNLIHSIGLYEKQVSGVEVSMSQYILVSHNSIYDTPRAGINISEGTWGGHVIENNDVFNTVKETGDHGSFNSWGRDRYWHPSYSTMEGIIEKDPALILADAERTTVIRNNRFRCDRGWDIDLDDGSSNYIICNNLCLNGGIKLREGFYRVVENNIMVNNSFHPHVWFKNSGDVFSRNIVMTEYKPIGMRKWGLMVDYNIFTDSLALAAAQGNGTDGNSIVCHLKFIDPASGDFSLEDDSEAITKGGFHNFPMDDFGVVSPRLKKLADAPEFPIPIISGSEAEDRIIDWNGVRLKSLNTLGERSATGMDSERGVYVISVDALGSKLRDYFKPNDVILRIENIEVSNLNDFEKAIKDIEKTSPIEFVIFRSQKENVISVPAGKL